MYDVRPHGIWECLDAHFCFLGDSRIAKLQIPPALADCGNDQKNLALLIYLNLEFHSWRTELEGTTMDIKKFIADLTAWYRKLMEQTPSTSLAGADADVNAAHEARRKAGHEAGHAEGYEAGREAGHEAGYEKGYNEGYQIGLEAKTPPQFEPPQASQTEPPPGTVIE